MEVGGEGDVTYTFRYDFHDYETNELCPICDGDGVVLHRGKPNGKKEFKKDF